MEVLFLNSPSATRIERGHDTVPARIWAQILSSISPWLAPFRPKCLLLSYCSDFNIRAGFKDVDHIFRADLLANLQLVCNKPCPSCHDTFLRDRRSGKKSYAANRSRIAESLKTIIGGGANVESFSAQLEAALPAIVITLSPLA